MGIYTRQDPRDRKIQEQQLAALLEQNRLLGGILAAVDYLARDADANTAERAAKEASR